MSTRFLADNIDTRKCTLYVCAGPIAVDKKSGFTFFKSSILFSRAAQLYIGDYKKLIDVETGDEFWVLIPDPEEIAQYWMKSDCNLQFRKEQ